MSDVTDLIERRGRAFDRGQVESLWQALADQFYPERANFTREITEGEELHQHLFDATPVMLRRDLANSFSAMLRPRDQAWMKASVAFKDDLRDQRNAERFFDHVTRQVRSGLYDGRAKFVQATKEADHDYATFGCAVMSCEGDPQSGSLRFKTHHLKDCAWEENHHGDVDTVYRDMKLTARQMGQMFRRDTDSLHRHVQQAINGENGRNREQKFCVTHMMMPREDYTPRGKLRGPKDAPWVSVYVDTTNQHLIREAVSYEFRYVVPRWQRVYGSVYAVSPAAMTALPDARMIQAMARVMLEAAEKQVDPPLAATAEAVLGDVNFAASGITWVDRMYDERLGPAIRPFELGKNIRLGVDMLERTANQLSEAWYVSKLNLPERGERTAYEMARRVEEYIRAAVPLFEPLETEYNVPLLNLATDILFRFGAIDQSIMPPELAGADLVWQFANPLQDALEKNKILAAETQYNLLAAAASLDQDVLVDHDTRAATRAALLASGPAEWTRPKAEADQALAERRQMQQMQQAIREAGEAGEAAQAAGEGVASVGAAAELVGGLAQ